MLDRDLAALYGVPTKALNQAVKRNKNRFPDEFMFRLTTKEKRELVTNCDRFQSLKHAVATPLAFTEYGVAMLSSVLKSRRAIRINVEIIQTFIRLRRLALSYEDVKGKIAKLERKVRGHDEQFREVYDALNQLQEMPEQPIDPPRKIPGFQP